MASPSAPANEAARIDQQQNTRASNAPSVAPDEKKGEMSKLPATDTLDKFLKLSIIKLQKDEKNHYYSILIWFIETVGVTTAVAFGIFSILSWTSTKTQTNLAQSQADSAQSQAAAAHSQAMEARAQARTANLLALAALCAPLVNNQTASINAGMRDLCDSFYAHALPSLASAAKSLIPSITLTAVPSGSIPAGTPSASSSAQPTQGAGGAGSGAGLDSSAATALGLALGLALPAIIVTVLSVLARRHQQQKQQAGYQALDLHAEAM